MSARQSSWDKIALAVLALLILGGIAGITYEQIERARDRERFPQIGRSVDIGGRALNIFCSGEGRPSVILQSGSAGYNWVSIQREIAKVTQACWYDRAGYGWSDPAPYARTSQDSARDLHALLHAAAVPPLYVLVAVTFAGLDARAYHGLYPG
ncbi:MAG TPA: hypothetical protein VMH81_39260, partial [Bryobacteraceae bacterium]|nr:hypothetical protein [Bryobacteraceae bacterium]